MGEPTYRWICTYCDASGVAESPEMAKLGVDVHVSLFHEPSREEIRAQSEAEGNVLIQQTDRPASSMAPSPSANHSPTRPPALILRSGGNWWRALVNFVRWGRLGIRRKNG